MGLIKRVFNVFKPDQTLKTEHATSMSIVKRMYTTREKLYEETIEFLQNDLEYYKKIAQETRSQSTEERMFSIAEKLFLPKQAGSGHLNASTEPDPKAQTTLGSGTFYSDDQIKQYVDQLTPTDISFIKSKPQIEVIEKVKSVAPHLNDETIIRAIAMVKN